MDPRPSPIVFTGGGFQPYWIFPKPIYTMEQFDIIERTVDANKSIARVLDGDDCWNINRFLRLPYTINLPTKTKLDRGRQPAETYVLPESWHEGN
jgi:hypothetical protein